MAQPIHCDAVGPSHLADVMVSRIATGEVTAWCDPDYVEVCRAITAAVDQVEADAAAAEAAKRLAGVQAPGLDPDTGSAMAAAAEGDADALAAAFPTSDGSSAADDPPAEPPTKPADGRKAAGVHSGASPSRNGRPGASPGATEATGPVTDPR